MGWFGMAKKNKKGLMEKFGPWAFVIGLVIAVVSAITQQVFWMLALLGLVVGLMNISEKELQLFLLASLTFLLCANALSVTLGKLADFVPFIGKWILYIDPLLANMVIFVAPGASIVALKALYTLAKD